MWRDHLTEEIQKVGEQEKALAIKKGQISSNGVPYIEVYVDGGWAKRSYGHDYNSASGMVNTYNFIILTLLNNFIYKCNFKSRYRSCWIII